MINKYIKNILLVSVFAMFCNNSFAINTIFDDDTVEAHINTDHRPGYNPGNQAVPGGGFIYDPNGDEPKDDDNTENEFECSKKLDANGNIYCCSSDNNTGDDKGETPTCSTGYQLGTCPSGEVCTTKDDSIGNKNACYHTCSNKSTKCFDNNNCGIDSYGCAYCKTTGVARPGYINNGTTNSGALKCIANCGSLGVTVVNNKENRLYSATCNNESFGQTVYSCIGKSPDYPLCYIISVKDTSTNAGSNGTSNTTLQYKDGNKGGNQEYKPVYSTDMF